MDKYVFVVIIDDINQRLGNGDNDHVVLSKTEAIMDRGATKK